MQDGYHIWDRGNIVNTVGLDNINGSKEYVRKQEREEI